MDNKIIKKELQDIYTKYNVIVDNHYIDTFNTYIKNKESVLHIGILYGENIINSINNMKPKSTIICIYKNDTKYTEQIIELIENYYPNRVSFYDTECYIKTINWLKNLYKYMIFDIINIEKGSIEYLIANDEYFLSIDILNKYSGYLFWNNNTIERRLLWDGYQHKKTNHITNEKFCIQLQDLEKKKDICILSLYLGDKYKRITEPSHLSKKWYSKKHNYDYKFDDEDFYDNTRPKPWSKINQILKYIDKYEYVVWIDADALIMNSDVKLEYIIENYMKDNLIMMAQDWICINSGVMFLKKSDKVIEFFKKVYSQEQFINSPCWEQDSIKYLIDTNWENCNSYINILPIYQQTIFNSFHYNYDINNFILHLAGCWKNDVESGLSRGIQDYNPIQMYNETYKNFMLRKEWIENSVKQKLKK